MSDETFEPEGFTLEQAETIVSVFACAQCEGELRIIGNDYDLCKEFKIELSHDEGERCYVICPDCGNVEQVGRISKTTVAIRNEQGRFEFPKYIHSLPDLWGELIHTKEQRDEIIKSLGF